MKNSRRDFIKVGALGAERWPLPLYIHRVGVRRLQHYEL
jgi:hypothetical protein